MFRATRPSPLILLSGLILATLGAAPLWHTPYLDGGAWWQARIPVDLTNPDDRESIGAFVALRIGKASGELPLVGKEARAIRLVSDTGVEYVFKIQDAAGAQQFEGPLAMGSALLLPAEVAAAKTERYYVYCDNPKAWRVPDMFQVHTADLRSNGFESAGPWNLGKARLSTERAASGKSCVKLAAEGENVAGITSPLIALPKDPKAIVKISFSVDLEFKSGIAFLLLRYSDKNGAPIATVRRESHLELLTLKESLGGWQRKTFTVGREGSDAEVKLPVNAENIVFHMNFWCPSGDNRGTLWLDDLTFDGISAPGGRVTAQIGVPETMALSAPKAEPAFAPGFAWRVPLEVRNLDLEPRERALGSLPLSRLRYQYGLDLDPRSVRLEDEGGKPVPLTLMENEAIFPARVGAKSLVRYYVYFGGQGAPSPQVPWESILKSDLNLVKNGDFEAGAALPDGWMGAVETANVGGAITYAADSTVKYERVPDSRFGKSAIRMTVPPNAAPGWYGWRQMVPGVRPNATYVYGAYVKAEKLTGDFRLYGHFKDAAGKTISTFATPPLGSMGTQDQASTVEGGRWFSLSTTIVTPGGTAAIEIHLTMNTKGVVWHDGVVLAESVAVEGGAAESAKGKGAGFSCWAVNNLLKVFPETVPASEAKGLSAGLARAEKEPIQFAVRSPIPIKDLKVSLSTLQNGSSRLGATLHRVGYVPVDFPVGYPQAAIGSPVKRVILQDRSTDGWTGWWPDPLLPARPFTLEADRSEAFLIILDSPAQAAPGTYTATLTLEGDGRTLRTLPISVTVWNFALPERPSISLQFEVGQGPRKFDMPAAAKLSNEALWRFMAERRASPGAITPEPVFKMEGGSVAVDFTAYDRSASYCFDTLKMRTSYLPNIFYGFGWGYSPKKFLGFAPFTPASAITCSTRC